MSKFVEFEEELYINVDKIIAVRRQNRDTPFGHQNVIIVTENESSIVLATEDFESVMSLIRKS